MRGVNKQLSSRRELIFIKFVVTRTHALACVQLPLGGRRVKGRTDFQLSWSWLNVIVLIDDRDLASIRRPISRQALFKSSYSPGSFIFAFFGAARVHHHYLTLGLSGLALQPGYLKAINTSFSLPAPHGATLLS